MGKTTEEKIDTIGRDEVINNIMNIIETVSANKGNTTFALDGVWGSGKTFVLEKLEKRLSNCPQESGEDNKYFVIHYNCWKYDYYEEPLIAIVSSVFEALNEKKFALNAGQRKIFKDSFSLIGKLVLDLVNIPAKVCLGVDVKKTAKQVGEFTKGRKTANDDNHKYDDYFKLKEVLNKITDGFEKISKNQTVVLVVDELDRCLPEYAIKVLERLHHLTDSLDNFVTIVGTDEKKLYSIIEQTFGYKNEDCSKYLKKFIKFSIQLDIGTAKDSITEKYQDYINQFDCSKWQGNFNFTEFFNLIFDRIDVREQENLMGKAFLIHRLITKEKLDVSVLFTELILLVLEHHYDTGFFYFKSGKFKPIPNEKKSSFINIVKLNNIFNPKATVLRSGNLKRDIYIINESSASNGIIFWYFSLLELGVADVQEEMTRISNDGISFVQLSSNYKYRDVCFNNYKIIKKFRDFIKIIK